MKKVLIVEDDKVALALFAKIVRLIGADVVSVRTSREAWDRVAAGSEFDLMLLDLILPMESGWDFLAKLRANPATAKVPVIIMTGADLSHDERERLLKRANVVLEKSKFEIDGFEETLRTFLSDPPDPANSSTDAPGKQI